MTPAMIRAPSTPTCAAAAGVDGGCLASRDDPPRVWPLERISSAELGRHPLRHVAAANASRSTHQTIRHFSRAGMTHVWRGCPAIRTSSRVRRAHRAGGLCDFAAQSPWPHAPTRRPCPCAAGMAGRACPPKAPSRRGDAPDPPPMAAEVIRGGALRGYAAKTAFENRAGRAIRHSAGHPAGPAGKNRIQGNFGADHAPRLFRHRENPSPDTSLQANRRSGGDSHAPPAFSTDIHSL
jgi:hypothetical protein